VEGLGSSLQTLFTDNDCRNDQNLTILQFTFTFLTSMFQGGKINDILGAKPPSPYLVRPLGHSPLKLKPF